MSSTIFSATTIGLDSLLVEVEVDVLTGGLHSFGLVGLPDTAVKEARERVGAALKNSGFKPVHQSGRITVNLAPADVPKNFPLFDVAIALGYLLEIKVLTGSLEKKLFVGELALSGKIRKVHGVLPIVLFAKKQGFNEVYVPLENQKEALLVEGITIYAVDSLREVTEHLLGAKKILAAVPEVEEDLNIQPEVDFAHIVSQKQAKRALEIAAAGGHNVIFIGAPGSGKTLLAKAFSGILPPLEREESLEVTKIYSIAGQNHKGGLIRMRPMRSPHHTASTTALVGGGSFPKPGELSLAHRGVLFLDEFSLFPKSILEALRQPLEDGVITVSRIKGTHQFPAKVMLLAAMNPCPCGYAGDTERLCQCSPYQIIKYNQRISGPIMDRIDLQVSVPRVTLSELGQKNSEEEKSRDIQLRVTQARKIQKERFLECEFLTNAEMDRAAMKRYTKLSLENQEFFAAAAATLELSARGYTRVLKVARTIADLSGSLDIEKEHLAEALQYRFSNE